jgi:hypothetical protein
LKTEHTNHESAEELSASITSSAKVAHESLDSDKIASTGQEVGNSKAESIRHAQNYQEPIVKDTQAKTLTTNLSREPKASEPGFSYDVSINDRFDPFAIIDDSSSIKPTYNAPIEPLGHRNTIPSHLSDKDSGIDVRSVGTSVSRTSMPNLTKKLPKPPDSLTRSLYIPTMSQLSDGGSSWMNHVGNSRMKL